MTRDAQHQTSDRERAAAQRTARLLALTAKLSEALTGDEVARITVEQGMEALGASKGSLFVVSRDGSALEHVQSIGYSDRTMQEYARIPLDSTVDMPIIDAARTGSAFFAQSYAELGERYPQILPRLQTTEGDSAIACLPLNVDARCIGVLGFRFPSARIIDEDERAFMVIMKRHCAQALARARAYEAERNARTVAEHAEEVSRRREDHLRVITDAVPALISFVGADERYQFVNKSYEEWFEKPPSDFIGRSLLETLGKDAYEGVRPHLTRVLRGEHVSYEAEIGYQHGGRRYVRATYTPQMDASGAVRGFVALVNDVSAEKRARDRVQFLAEASDILSSSLDYETTLKAVAERAVPALADWCAIEMLNDDGTITQLAVAHVDPLEIEQAQRMRRRYPFDPSKDGGLHNVLRTGVAELHNDVESAVIVPIAIHEKVIGAFRLVGSAQRRFDTHDLDLAKELARRAGLAIENARLYRGAQEAIRKRDEFLSIASHELKTPLTSLQLTVDGLVLAAEKDHLRTLSRDRIVDRLHRARGQLERQTKLINQLLDVSRVSAGRLQLVRSEMDFAALVQEVVGRAQDEAMRTGSTLRCECESALTGHWDRDRLDQVVTNLLSNAIKYGAGRPIDVRLEKRENGALLRVVDRGIGISQADQTRIFDRFERASSSFDYSGMGLGLWIVKQIVEAHGGQVRVTSQLGEGAVFEVEIPLSFDAGGDA